MTPGVDKEAAGLLAHALIKNRGMTRLPTDRRQRGTHFDAASPHGKLHLKYISQHGTRYSCQSMPPQKLGEEEKTYRERCMSTLAICMQELILRLHQPPSDHAADSNRRWLRAVSDELANYRRRFPLESHLPQQQELLLQYASIFTAAQQAWLPRGTNLFEGGATKPAGFRERVAANSGRLSDARVLLSDSEISTLQLSPCEFCGATQKGADAYCHIARLGKGPYVAGNVASSCGKCYKTRYGLPPATYRQYARRITAHMEGRPSLPLRPRAPGDLTNGSSRQCATMRRRAGDICPTAPPISCEDYFAATSKPCYLCGTTAVPRGLDRNGPCYDLKTTGSCCYQCNAMKRAVSLDKFMRHMTSVGAKNKDKKRRS
jgi:hypothetical protein